MNKITPKLFRTLACLIAIGAIVVIAACSGDTSRDSSVSDDSRSDDIFVAEDSGTITVKPTSSSFPVGATSGFLVTVRGADGTPQPNVAVTCDSEKGLPIVEPSTGSGLTDDFGTYSGVVGCGAPGSFRFGCKTPGIGLRHFVTINCTGSIPDGFAGFPGAGGENLGGGVSNTDDDNTGNVRITEIVIADDGNVGGDTGGFSVDIVADTCDDSTAEPFYDAYAQLTVVNDSNSDVTFRQLRYSVNNYDNLGGQFNSQDISLIGSSAALDANGGKDLVVGLFMTATSGSKSFIGDPQTIQFSGARNITFRLDGRTGSGESFTISGRTAITFANYDNCS